MQAKKNEKEEKINPKDLSVEEKIRLAKKFRKEGKSYRDIARILKVSPTMVYKYIKRKEKEDDEAEEEKEEAPEDTLEALRDQIPKRGKLRNSLDQSYASVLMTLMRNIEWFNAVMSRVGFYAMMLAFQIAKIPPEQIPQKIEEFQDPDRFSAYVLDILSTLPIALEDAMEIYRMRKTIQKYRIVVSMLIKAAQELMRRTRELRNMLEIAVASMDDKSKADFLTNLYVSGLLRSLLGSSWSDERSEEEAKKRKTWREPKKNPLQNARIF